MHYVLIHGNANLSNFELQSFYFLFLEVVFNKIKMFILHVSDETALYTNWLLMFFPQWSIQSSALRWRHNERDGSSNHQPHDWLLKRSFRRRSKKTKLRVTGLCAGNSPVTGEFPAQMASNAEDVSIWWRHHGIRLSFRIFYYSRLH